MHWDINWGQLGDAGILIGVGMSVVFVGLIILMIAIMIMNRLFPDKGKKTEGSALLEAIETEKSERERVALLAVALARAVEEERQGNSQEGMMGMVGWSGEPSRWVVSGREQAIRSRGKAGRQWGRRSD